MKNLIAEFESRGGLGDPTEADYDRMTEDQLWWLELMQANHGDARVGWDCQNLLVVCRRAAAYVDLDGVVETAAL